VSTTQPQISPAEFERRLALIVTAVSLDGDGKRLLARKLVHEALRSLGYGPGVALLEQVEKAI
jgi:hypothetical protein